MSVVVVVEVVLVVVVAVVVVVVVADDDDDADGATRALDRPNLNLAKGVEFVTKSQFITF